MKTFYSKAFINALFIVIVSVTTTLPVYGQDDLLGEIGEDSTKKEKDFVLATFKSTRIINFHTSECLGKRSLDFRISHRFGEWSSGSYNFYGIDGPANIRLGLEYSYDGRWMAGIGRSSYEKMYDGFLKFRWLRQTTDNRMPISLTVVSAIYMTRLKDPQAENGGPDRYKYFSNRLSFSNQAIVARKFTSKFSAQLAPSIVHYNQAENFTDNNDSYHIAVAARYKVSKRIALTAEYSYTLKENTQQEVYNPIGFGMDIETGGHVFQLFVTNAFGITENQFLPYTTSSWSDKGWRIGFNVSRVFSI
jgi:hypothetical protein